MILVGEERWLNVSGDTITAVGDAGDGNKGSPPPKALLRLPPLMFCGGIVGQLKQDIEGGWANFHCQGDISSPCGDLFIELPF